MRATASQKTSHGARLRKLTWHFSRGVPCHLPGPTHRLPLVDAPRVLSVSERVEVALYKPAPSIANLLTGGGHCVKYAPEPIDKSVGQWVVDGAVPLCLLGFPECRVVTLLWTRGENLFKRPASASSSSITGESFTNPTRYRASSGSSTVYKRWVELSSRPGKG